ncbi:hypothetical protein RND81_08G023100 [Saponaria officinalis]|uniref:Retrotransposon gag domain-containing protein n=1 Tax=Saponaria officinalis TaxID=3572 RepID=A0AAW1J2L4_SAPOF
MSEERLSKVEEKLSGITEIINVLVGAVNKLTAEKGQPGGTGDDEEAPRNHHHEDVDQHIKVELPDFHGTLNPEELLEWLRAVERIFEYKGYDDAKKFKVAILKFKGYASLWYEGVKQQRAQARKEPLKSWEKLKKKLQTKFISADYTQELFLKLTHLKQNEGIVESYLRDFEQLTLQCEIQERPEQKIARFLEGLDGRIADKVRLQPLWSLDEVVRFSVEDLRRKCYQCQGYGYYSRDCPTKKTLTLRDVQEIEEQGELLSEATEEMTEHETKKEVTLPPDEGTALVVCRVMHSHPTPLEEDQRQKIFQTRCTVMGKICNVLVDSGSYTNAASTVLVEKLNLPTIDHPQPYKLRWLSKGTEVQVDKQVLLPFSIGKTYSDQVLCDIIPMDACHILLGRPWEFDRDVIHLGRDNTYSFKYEGRKITLTPMASPIHHRSGPEICRKAKDSLLLKEAEFVKEASKQGVIYALLTKEVHEPQPEKIDSGVAELLREFIDVFPEELPPGLPPLRGIEHQIDLVPGATLPNKAA